jgi:chromate transporter
MTERVCHTSGRAPAAKVRLASLFASFVRVGGGMFGGGYAMLPLLEREMVERRCWATHDAMSDLFALAQVIPGVIAINTAMLIGQRLRGWRGAVAAALGTIAVPFFSILLLACSFAVLAHNPWVARFIAGLRPAVAGLLLGTAIRLVWRGWRKRWAWAVGLTVTALTLACSLNPVWPILAGLASGLLAQVIRSRRQGQETC